jgi:hypothetical protein
LYGVHPAAKQPCADEREHGYGDGGDQHDPPQADEEGIPLGGRDRRGDDQERIVRMQLRVR